MQLTVPPAATLELTDSQVRSSLAALGSTVAPATTQASVSAGGAGWQDGSVKRSECQCPDCKGATPSDHPSLSVSPCWQGEGTLQLSGLAGSQTQLEPDS